MKNTGNKEYERLQWLRERTEYLSGFMLPEREQRMRGTVGQRTRYITVCMENIFHPQNASALVRHCDAFGLQDIHAVESLCRFRPNVNIVQGTDKWITFHRYPTTADALRCLKSAGYRIAATTPAGGAPPEDFDVTAGKFALIFGTEHAGISREIVEAADEFITIPMHGFVDSLNVSASAAILIYILSQKVRTQGIDWKLAETESEELIFEWMQRSIRDCGQILSRGGLSGTFSIEEEVE